MGQDLNLATDRVLASRNFANKLWNAGKFILASLAALPQQARSCSQDRVRRCNCPAQMIAASVKARPHESLSSGLHLRFISISLSFFLSSGPAPLAACTPGCTLNRGCLTAQCAVRQLSFPAPSHSQVRML